MPRGNSFADAKSVKGAIGVTTVKVLPARVIEVKLRLPPHRLQGNAAKD